MVDPLEELIRRSMEFHSRLIEENNELDRAFQSGTFGKLVQSWSEIDGGTDDETEDVGGEAGTDVVGRESRRASGEPEAGSETV
tara:strand:+ start:33720 stop:33971 length:252 start_codon:yes stop_codon:yes gene_type:complete